MAEIVLQGTKFTFSILPVKLFAKDSWARVEIEVKNPYVSYKQTEKISADALEEWIFSMFRLLAGAYKREYNLSFEDAGFAVDFYAYTDDGEEVSRQERRKRDCVMAFRMLMRSDKRAFLGGVYSLLFHREEVELFVKELRKEYDKAFVKRVHGTGECMFVGVSPLGCYGCNYWYFDASGEAQAGDYVWVEMGTRDTKQIVYVDSVRYFHEEDAPYPLDSVKQVLSDATDAEVAQAKRQAKV